MGWHSVKLYPADTAFSRFIRLRDKQCVLCGRTGSGPEGIFGLQASHFYSRGKWNVRFDPKNLDALCISCHKKVHKGATEYEEFKVKQLGQAGFDALTARAWSRSEMGSNFWKILTKKQAEELFAQL